jgi:hypothetical protein
VTSVVRVPVTFNTTPTASAGTGPTPAICTSIVPPPVSAAAGAPMALRVSRMR